MTLTLSWPPVAAGPRLRSFMFSTIVLQNRGVCSCWKFQGASQNGGGLLTCSEGAECSAVVCTVIHAVDMMETVDGSGSGGVFIHANPVNCGSIVATGTCIRHLLEQFFNRHGSRNRLRARGPRPQGHVSQNLGGTQSATHFDNLHVRRYTVGHNRICNARGAHGPDARAEKAKPVRVRRCPATVREIYLARPFMNEGNLVLEKQAGKFPSQVDRLCRALETSRGLGDGVTPAGLGQDFTDNVRSRMRSDVSVSVAVSSGAARAQIPCTHD